MVNSGIWHAKNHHIANTMLHSYWNILDTKYRIHVHVRPTIGSNGNVQIGSFTL